MKMDSRQFVGYAIGLLLVGVLFPIGLASLESYTPTDATILVVWPLIGVMAVLAVAVKFIYDAVA